MRRPPLGSMVAYQYHDNMRGTMQSEGTVVQVIECWAHNRPAFMVLVADDGNGLVRLATAILGYGDAVGVRTEV